MKRTSGTLSARRANSSRRAPTARRRSSCESGISGPLPPRPRDRFHPLEDRKEPGQREDVARKERLGLVRGKSPQVLRQRVDQAVEGLVRHGLPLVAAPREDDAAGLPLGEVLQEAADERALAHPGGAAHEERDAAPLLRSRERLVEGGELLLSPDEGGAVRGPRSASRREPRPGFAAAQAAEDVGARRAARPRRGGAARSRAGRDPPGCPGPARAAERPRTAASARGPRSAPP